ncbi:helix-turn-helix domain-containing protein [Nocardia sp. NPDC004860]
MATLVEADILEQSVHYRIERIERLTGRDLSRLDDRIDLRAALRAAGA